MPVEISRRRFTVDDYHRMADAGILCEDDRVELIEGEVVTMSPVDPPHSAHVDRTARTLFRAAGDAAIVRVQSPVRLNRFTEPQPDLSVLRQQADFYASGHPGAPDVLLIVEIADSSLRYDRSVKARIYAAGGIREYWVVDVSGGIVFRHVDPRHGSYRSISEFRRGERIAPELLTGALIPVDDLIGE